jgi:hypothetical protein
LSARASYHTWRATIARPRGGGNEAMAVQLFRVCVLDAFNALVGDISLGLARLGSGFLDNSR